MTISTIEESEIPEYMVPFTLVYSTVANASANTNEVCAAGHHPKCRIVRGQVVSLVI